MSPISVSGRSCESPERTLLLGSSGERTRLAKARTVSPSDLSLNDNAGKDVESLPKFQILLLCYARLMEPIAFFSIFPYIAQMVQRNGELQDSDVGFYSGLVESLFSATQTVVLVFWGALADRLGRKKMLIYSLVGMAIGPALFGMTTNLWQMSLFRSFTGIFSGANLIIRTMVGEISTAETQAKAFSWYSVAGNLGIFLSPIIGGALADPASQYPSAFGGFDFFEKHPYALPGFVVGAISATAAISSALFLEETLKEEKVQVRSKGVPWKSSFRQLLEAPNISAVFGIYGYVMLLAFAFTALLPVVLYTPVDLGGMECSTSEITLYITVLGASETLWLMFVFPFLQRRLGTKGVLRICSFGWPCFFAGYILLNALLREKGKAARVLSFVVGSINFLIGPGPWMSFTAVQLAVNDASPSPQVLGKINSIAELCSSVIRTIIPGIATAIFAVGVRGQIVSGYLAWVILILLALGLPFALKWFPEDRKNQGSRSSR